MKTLTHRRTHPTTTSLQEGDWVRVDGPASDPYQGSTGRVRSIRGALAVVDFADLSSGTFHSGNLTKGKR